MNYEKGRRIPGHVRLTGEERFTAPDLYAGKPVQVLVDEVTLQGFEYLRGDEVQFAYTGEGTHIRADGTPGSRRVTGVTLTADDVPAAVRAYLHVCDVEDAARFLNIADERQRIGRARITTATANPT